MELVLIAAVARNGAIGRGNDLVFRDRADLQHLRTATMGHPVVMGRKTWDSLPERFRPLPGRRNIVVSRNAAFSAPGADVFSSLPEALQAYADAAKVFVIGGAQLYALALPLAHTLLLTEVDADLDGDAFFPPWPRAEFTELSRQPQRASEGTRFDFVHYSRRS